VFFHNPKQDFYGAISQCLKMLAIFRQSFQTSPPNFAFSFVAFHLFMSFLDALNPVQRQAAECTEGPVMIIAGAGSGKTRVITYRIAYLLTLGVEPFRIMSLTFTNKAAAEMRHRIEALVGNDARNLWMGTFHSVFARVLRVEAQKIGFPANFTIYDTDDSKSLLKQIIKEEQLDETLYKPNFVYNRISAAKNNLIGPGQYAQDPDLVSNDAATGRPRIAELYAKYAARCFKAGAMDFDDLLLKTYTLLVQHPDVLNKYQHRFSHILVDEYQDTNFAQYKIVKLLAASHQNICVVGDDAQSIYAFRGADIQNILNFEADYPDLHTFKLEQNYRSTETIVKAAGNVIAKNKNQFKKNLWTGNDLGSKIKLFRAGGEREEAGLVANNIFEEKLRNQRLNKEFAILYRTNAQSRAMEEALRKMNIPYRVYGGLSFYQRKEVKDLLSYMRLTMNPNDEEAFRRVVNYPARGIGKVSLDRLLVVAAQREISLLEAARNAYALSMGASAAKLMAFATMIDSFATLSEKMDAFELATYIAKQSTMLHDLNEDKSVEGVSRAENIQELLAGIKEFTEDPEIEDQSLGAYLQNVSLMTGTEKEDPNADTVLMMTIHAAKGLEFPFVYIVGLEEGLFPSQMSTTTREELEEERRLFYVAITRAEKQLFLSYATSRFRAGQMQFGEQSRFIEEIGMDFIQPENFATPSANASEARYPVSGITTQRPPAPRVNIVKPQQVYHPNPDFSQATPATFKPATGWNTSASAKAPWETSMG